MTRGIERREISSHAGADQRYWIAARGALNHGELPANRELLESAFRQVRDFETHSQLGEPFPKEAGLLGRRAAGKTVQIDKSPHLLLTDHRTGPSPALPPWSIALLLR